MDTILQLHAWLEDLIFSYPYLAITVVLVAIFVAWIIMFRITMHFDGRRVSRYLNKQRCVLEDFRWRPFGPGWYGERNARIYRIQYRDADECVHIAYVKTSLWSGVYLTKDKIVYDGRSVVGQV